MDTSAGLRDRQHDLRVHDHPRRSSSSAWRSGRCSSTISVHGSPTRSDCWRWRRSWSPLSSMAGLVVVVDRPEALMPGQRMATLEALIGSAILVVLPVTIVLGLSFPAASALLSDDAEHAGSESGSLVAVEYGRCHRRQRDHPVPAHSCTRIATRGRRSSRSSNVAVGIALAFRTLEPRRPLIAIGLVVAVVVASVGFIPGALAQPNEAYLRAAGARIFDSTEDEIASVQAGQLNFTPGTVGRRHLDDAADCRCQADADPAAHRAAGFEARSRRRVRDGLRVSRRR